ncbi:hypothetical protein AMK27_24430 [Streptomyces sp. CB02009]|uniref:hypothetical protein n=1 Tax=Streptomyces sp. CB02009 TaxID=1703938 RepID=UPI000939B18E|nr:hypothetical protein [Streptomyces sp. CB02009]OKJ56858.1 hypothetical protein AMK27_24430 [Streptomyces sp. CB02009]
MTAALTPPPPRTAGRAGRAPRPVVIELRRGIGPWAGAAVLLTVLLTMYGKAPGWQGRWADATNMLHVASGLLAGPLALAAGCWQGGRDRRRGTLDLWESVPRSPLRRLFAAVAPSALWPAGGVLLADAVCLLATWPYVSGGRPFLELLAADAVAVAALGAFGHVVGCAVRWRLTAPLLGIAGYVALGVGAYGQGPSRWLGPAAEHQFLWDRPVWWFGPVSMAWTAGLALTALLAYGLRGARLRALALVPLAVAVAAAALILRLPTDEGPWRPDPALARPLCDDGTPQICLTAVDERLLPEVSAALAPLNARLKGLPGAPVRWVGGPFGPPRPGDVELPNAAADAVRGRLPRPDLYLNAAVSWLFSDTCRPGDNTGPDAERASLVNLAVIEWLAPTPAGYGPDPTAAQPFIDRLRAKSPAEQRDFLGRYLAANTCHPDEVPVP